MHYSAYVGTSAPPGVPPGIPLAETLERVRTLLHRAMESASDRLVLAALRHGSQRVVVLPEDEYDSFIATLELDEDPEAQEDLRVSQEEFRHALPPSWGEVREELGLGNRQTK